MAENNPLADYLGLDMARQQDMTVTEIMFRQREAMYRQQQNLQMQRQAMLAQMNNRVVWYADYADAQWLGAAPEKFEITGGEGNIFVARFTCPITGESAEITSIEKPAAERGIRHLIGKWNTALRHLQDAGLKEDELRPPMAVLKPRMLTDAQRERDLEEGVRQAESKAKSLLLLCLTPEQQAEFNEHHRFTIKVDHKVSGFPTGAFRIEKGSAFNVEHVESGETFCVVAQEKVPVYDQMLTQKLLLEQEPERFFKTANRSGGGMYLFANEYANIIADDWNRIEPPPRVAPPPDRTPDNPFREAIREFTERHRR